MDINNEGMLEETEGFHLGGIKAHFTGYVHVEWVYKKDSHGWTISKNVTYQ